MKKLTLSLLALLALTAGCAKTTLNIDPSSNSQALQVARAANLSQVRDQKIPQEDFNRLADSTLYNAAWATTMYFNPAPGFSSGSSLALALPSLFLTPARPVDGYKHIIAWMPQELAKDANEAQAKMDATLIEALEKTAKQFDYADYRTDNLVYKNRKITVLYFEDEESVCRAEKNFYCSFANRLLKPEIRPTPNFLKATHSQSSYFFPLEKYDDLHFLSRNEDLPQLDQLKMLQVYSEQLPEWVYLYLAPKSVHNEKGELLQYPFILHQGKTLLFVKPE